MAMTPGVTMTPGAFWSHAPWLNPVVGAPVHSRAPAAEGVATSSGHGHGRQGSWNQPHQGQSQFGDYFYPTSSQPPKPSGETGYFPPVSIADEILRKGSGLESATFSSEDGMSRGQGGDEHDEKEGDRSPVSASTGTGTGTGRDGSESSGTRATSPDMYLTEPRDGETKSSCEGSGVSAHPIRRTTSAQCEGGIVKRGVLSHRESDPALTLTTGGASKEA